MSTSLIRPRLLLALALLGIGAGLSVAAWNGPSDAMLVPRVVLSIWCLVAVLIVVTELVKGAPAVAPSFSPLPLLMVAVLVAALTMKHIGFLLPSLPLVALTLWLFRVRRPLPLMLATTLIAGGLWFLFHHVLLIRLPSLLTSGVV